MIGFIEKIKFIIIEYIHLLLLVFILFSLYINNMPVNFQLDKILKSHVPDTFTKEMAEKYGIKDPQNSKLYSILSWIYGVIRSFLSPNFKTMMFKLVILIFIIGLATGVKYSSMIFWLSISVLSISAIFWCILYVAEWVGETYKNSGYYKFIQNNFNNIQADSWYIFPLNTIISTSIIAGLYFLLHSELIKKNPIHITLIVLLCIFILYFRIDGILYFFKEGVWESYLVPYGKEWIKNMWDDPMEDKIGRWIALSFYLVIFGMILLIHKKPNLFQGSVTKYIKDFSIFNNLIDKTNHPKAVLGFYIWFFLLRTTYTFWWFIIFIILTGGEVGYKLLMDKYGGQINTIMPRVAIPKTVATKSANVEST
jgi:hypothetical protein